MARNAERSVYELLSHCVVSSVLQIRPLHFKVCVPLIKSAFTVHLTVFSRLRVFVAEIECTLMSQKAADAAHGCFAPCLQMANASFVFR